MTFRVLLHRKVAKYLKDLHPTVQERIKGDLKTLKDFPATRLDLIKVAGENDVYRIRFGQLRALFKVYNREKIIVVFKIDQRKRVYR